MTYNIFSILFWTEEQKKLLDSFYQRKPTIICGDYGTGKTVVLFSVVENLIEEGNQVLFINANDYIRTQDYKTWLDVMDVIVRSKFKDVTFLDIGTLRRESQNRGILMIFKSIVKLYSTICSRPKYAGVD